MSSINEQQRKRLIITLLVALPLGGYALFSSRGVFSRVSLEWEKRKLQETITTMKLQQDSLKHVVKSLESDTLLLEKIARERYGMIKPGEQIYLIEKKQQNK
jgi:cell division protein FtsB